MRQILINDITLRDGEQSAGVNFFPEEKLRIAQQLFRMRVPVMEVGFAVASKSDWDGVNLIAKTLGTSEDSPVLCSMCRAVERDIDAAWEALRPARRPRIQVVLSTSDIHLTHKLQISRAEALAIAQRTVSYARRFVEDVEFAAEDATRTDRDFLVEVFTVAAKAGASTLEIPDTVGYATPADYGELVRIVVEQVGKPYGAVVSTHCHDDLGMAVANTLFGIANGAGQAEVTINGIGERAGNASLEEVVMALKTRPAVFGAATALDTTGIAEASRLVAELSGMVVAPNKAIVGRNAFAHESGIHQHGMLKNALTYQILDPAEVGIQKSALVLGKLSGKHALRAKLDEFGIAVEDGRFDEIYEAFKDLASKKKMLLEEDLRNLVRRTVAVTA